MPVEMEKIGIRKDFEIIGHPITLHSVIKMIINLSPPAFSQVVRAGVKEVSDILSIWDFSKEDNLEVQIEANPELEKFLMEILCPK
jgi:hypothetical protein